jgi:hypothetical protein
MIATVEPLLPVSATLNSYSKEHEYSAETRDFSRNILNKTDEWIKEVTFFQTLANERKNQVLMRSYQSRLQNYSLIIKYFDTTCSHKKEFQEYPNIFLKIKEKFN